MLYSGRVTDDDGRQEIRTGNIELLAVACAGQKSVSTSISRKPRSAPPSALRFRSFISDDAALGLRRGLLAPAGRREPSIRLRVGSWIDAGRNSIMIARVVALAGFVALAIVTTPAFAADVNYTCSEGTRLTAMFSRARRFAWKCCSRHRRRQREGHPAASEVRRRRPLCQRRDGILDQGKRRHADARRPQGNVPGEVARVERSETRDCAMWRIRSRISLRSIRATG